MVAHLAGASKRRQVTLLRVDGDELMDFLTKNVRRRRPAEAGNGKSRIAPRHLLSSHPKPLARAQLEHWNQGGEVHLRQGLEAWAGEKVALHQ
jgi:hypothetical protein